MLKIKKIFSVFVGAARAVNGLMTASLGLKTFGGVNAPYVWVKTPDGISSWEFFDLMLHRCGVACTPGVGFGPSGEGYVRLTAFNTLENTEKAIARLSKLF